MKDKMKLESKRRLLKELKKSMMDDAHEGLEDQIKGMSKVTVMSDSEDGLEEGLSKAKEILSKREGLLGESEEDELEEESDDEEMSDSDPRKELLKKLKKRK